MKPSRRPELALLLLYHILRDISNGMPVSKETFRTALASLSMEAILKAFQSGTISDFIAAMCQRPQSEVEPAADVDSTFEQLFEALTLDRERLAERMPAVDQAIGRFFMEVLDSDAFVSKLRRRLESLLKHCPDDFSRLKSSIRGEVILKIWQKYQAGYFEERTFEDDNFWLSFLAVIAANKVIERWRRNSHVRTCDDLESLPYQVPDEDRFQDETSSTLALAVRKCVQGEEAELVFNGRLNGRPDSETAEVLGIHRGTVDRRFQSMINCIRHHLEAQGITEP